MKRLFRYSNNKQKYKKNIGLLLSRRCELVINNAEKSEILNTTFTSVFASTVGSRTLGRIFWVDANTDLPVAKEELVFELLLKLDPSKSMGPENIHLSVLRDLADVTVRLHSIILEKLWKLGDSQKPAGKLKATLFAGRA